MSRIRFAPLPCAHPGRKRFARDACRPCFMAWYASTPSALRRRNRPPDPAYLLRTPPSERGRALDARRIVDALAASVAPTTLGYVATELLRRVMLVTR